MKDNKRIIRDEDGIIIYDSTDDLFEEVTENEIQESKSSSGDYMEVLDESDGKFYKMPQMRPEFTGKTLAIYDLEGNLIKRFDEKKSIPKKFYSWLRQLFCFLIISLSTFLNITAQVFNPDKPMIEPFIVGVNDINERVGDYQGHALLNEEDGFVFLPNSYYTHNGKSNGILIVKDFTGTYQAFDARCAHCFYDLGDTSGVVKIPGSLFGKCNNCGAMVDNIIVWGSGQMNSYDHGIKGPVYLDGYLVKEYKKNGKLYLWIYNAPNGAHEEWKQQPENQAIVEAYRKMYHGDSGWCL